MDEIAYCCTVKNRIGNLLRLVESLNQIVNPGKFELVLGDYQSTDANLVRSLAGQSFPVTIVTIKKASFNRSQGLNIAAAHWYKKPPSRLFFIDTDMLVPANFNDMIRMNVITGRCWFPICYSLHKGKPPVIQHSSKFPKKANGWWRKSGKGMLGITRGDFERVGEWDEQIGVSYGNEDGDIARRLSASKVLLRRDKCVGLFHVWHPTDNAFKTKHHKVKGLGRKARSGKYTPPVPPKLAVHRLAPK